MRISSRFVSLALGVALAAGCSGNRDKLIAALQSPRPEERAIAVRKLASQGHPDDLVLFTRAAKDPAAMVRSEAAEALAQSQDPRVVDLLGELLEDPDETVQGNAAMALAHFKSDKSKAYLTSQYGRRGPSTRAAIVQALNAANVPGAMAGAVAAEGNAIWERNLRALNDGTLPERVGAAEELGKSGKPNAVNLLLPMVKDSQVILAAAAVRGLGYAGDRRAVAPIAELLTENFPELRESATQALLRLNDPSALPQLKSVAVEKSSASSLATAAVIALPRLPATDQALCEIAFEGAPSDATAAGREMRKRGGCPKEMISDRLGRANVLVSALQGLEGLGPTAKEATPRVLPLLSNSDPRVREQAIRALVEIGDASAVAPVQKVYDSELKSLEGFRQKWITAKLPEKYDEDLDPSSPDRFIGTGDSPETQEKRRDLLGRVRQLNQARAKTSGRAVIEPRVPVEVADDAPEDRLAVLAAAIRALGVLHAPDALKTLQTHVGDPSPSLRAAAFVGLASLGGDGISITKRGLTDPDRDVQGASAGALAAQGETGQQALIDLLPKLGDKMRLVDAIDRAGPVPAAAGPLIAVLQEGGAESAIAAHALGTLKAKDAVDPLLKALRDPTGIARRDVLQALGKIGDSKAAEAVAKDLFHDSPEVRVAAVEALAQIGSGAQLQALDALRGDYYLRVREAADQAVTKLGGATAEAPR